MSIVSKKIMMGSGAAGDPVDDEFNRTSFLSHFDGTNNGVNNQFTDGSASNHTITANGNVTQGSFGPFARPDGEWGWFFDGSDYLDMPDSGDFELASGDFTVAAWLFPHVDGSGYQSVISHALHSGTVGWSVWYQANKLQFFVNNSRQYLTSGTFAANEWTHVAVVRTGNTLKLFINGDEDLSTSFSDFTNSTTRLTIGASPNWNTTYYYTGIISNVLVLKGTALYTGDFTPPTSKYTAITNTSLLTCQSNRFVDNSASGHVITLSGNPTILAFGPFLTDAVYDPAVNGASMECDGSGDYLSLAYDADFNFGTGSFTIEAFVFFKDLSGIQGLYATNTGENPVPKWVMYLDGETPKIHINALNGSGSFYMNATTNLTANSWNHLAYVRNGSTWYWFINGTQAGTGSNSTNITFSNVATTIGYGGEPYFTTMNGFISDLRVVKGTAVYTSNFTPPTAPVTAITNTKLLLNMADGQAIDSAAQNNLTFYGNANTSTDQAKFGDTSLHLDGTGDYALFPHSSTNDISGAGDWTVELFWRSDDVTHNDVHEIVAKGIGFQIVGDARGSLNGNIGIGLSANNSGTYFMSGSGSALSNNTWYHIAVVKYGTSYKLYLDGTADISATSSSNVSTGTNSWALGALYDGSLPSKGYLDEFRVSQFARYTSNFTAPTAAFPDKGQ